MTESPSDDFKPPTTDPWKGFRGVCAGTLVLEMIVVLLTLPVLSTVGGGLTWASGTYVGVLALAMFLGSGLQRRSWAIPFDIALQIGLILGFFAHPSIGFIGVVFAGVWAYIVYLQRDIGQRIEKGMLPGQRD